MKIVFMGTPDFAVQSLESICNEGYDVVGVFCQPDKPVGRKQILTPPPVKELAVSKGLKVFQPNSAKNGEAFEILKELNPDIIIVVAYGKILPTNILELPKYGCVNLHGSVLPKYRGSAPIQWSVINGDSVAGVTTQLMNEGVDTGDILGVETCPIQIDDTSGDMYEKLKTIGSTLLIKTIKELENGTANPVKQDESKASHAPMLNKEMAKIDFNCSALQIHNKVRGLSPWPVAYTIVEGKTLKLHKTTVINEQTNAPVGSVVSENPFCIACGDNNQLLIEELQYEGKKRMNALDFLRGHKIEKGTILGE